MRLEKFRDKKRKQLKWLFNSVKLFVSVANFANISLESYKNRNEMVVRCIESDGRQNLPELTMNT